MKIAIYARVSTAEQAIHGLSVEAQLADLKEWANKNGHIVVDEYIDGGISGKKPPSKRPALSRFFSDLDSGLSVDALCFTKLDRFFRSVKLYYQAVDVLDKHKVAWQAIQEDYETVTASGRMKVNIMLSVAENEADRTSERVKTVFQHKIANNEWVAPQGLCIGYSIENKRLVPNDDAPAIRAAFQYYIDSHSLIATADYLRNEFNIDCMTTPLRRVLKNKIYTGCYRNNHNFCEPIVSQELFDKVQQEMQSRSVRKNQSNRIYIFAGLCECAVCNHAMSGMTTKKSGHEYHNYRCNNSHLQHRCPNRKMISEKKLENYLLDNVASQLDALIEEHKYDIQPKHKPKKKNTENVQKKLDRLKDLYVDGLIDKAQYLAERNKILESISQQDGATQQADCRALRKLLGEGFKTQYVSMNDQEKRTFWRALIKRIYIDGDRNVRFIFAE